MCMLNTMMWKKMYRERWALHDGERLLQPLQRLLALLWKAGEAGVGMRDVMSHKTGDFT